MPKLKPKANTQDIMIGADPELFAVNFKGEVLSVHDILPGTKASPLQVPKGAIQVDGIAAEFNIEPAKNRKEFLYNIEHVMRLMTMLLHRTHPGLTLRADPVAHLSREYMSQLPLNALALGCEPDYNAYTGKPQPKPSETALFRTGSGHVHVSWTKDRNPLNKKHFMTCRNLVQEWDFVLYPQSKMWDNDTQRMELYGKPGSFRPKSYGAEYRVLSNAWLRETMTRQFVYDACRAVTEQYFKGFMPSKKFGKMPTDDYTGYVKFLQRHHLPYIGDYGRYANVAENMAKMDIDGQLADYHGA